MKWPWHREPDTLRATYDAIQESAQNRAELRTLITTLHGLFVDEVRDTPRDVGGRTE